MRRIQLIEVRQMRGSHKARRLRVERILPSTSHEIRSHSQIGHGTRLRDWLEVARPFVVVELERIADHHSGDMVGGEAGFARRARAGRHIHRRHSFAPETWTMRG